MELKLVSDDTRRKLSEFGNGGTWKVCKVLETKSDCRVGGHYHKLKDEMFVLLEGAGVFDVGTTINFYQAPYSVFVPRGIPHTFDLKKGSVLIGLATELHDPTDDYKI